MTQWTEAMDDIVRTNRGRISAEEISTLVSRAAGYFLSRNAVIGRSGRLGLPPIQPKPQTMKPVEPKSVVIRTPVTTKPLPKLSPAPVDQPSLDIPFVQLKSMHCREIIGKGKDGLSLSCGRQKQQGSSYCPWHHRKNHGGQE